jgi:hypothetical protein
MREGVAAIEALTSTDGDDQASLGTTVGPCQRSAPRSIRCFIMDHESAGYGDRSGWTVMWLSHEVAVHTATAALRPDGVHTTTRALEPRLNPLRDAPGLRTSVRRRQAIDSEPVVRARVIAPDGGMAHVGGHIEVGTTERTRRLVALRGQTRRLRPNQSWSLRLRLSAHQRRRVLRRLASGLPVYASVEAKLTVDAGPGPAITTLARGLRLVRGSS